MKRQSRITTAIQCLCLAVFAAGGSAYAQAPPKQPAKVVQAVKGAKAVETYSEFDAKLQEYVRLHNRLEASLPRLGPKETAEKITAHELALAQKIREARANAKQGDIFIPEVGTRIKGFFKQEMTKAPKAKLVKNTIKDGEPLKDIALRIGMQYPEKLPMTTVPPDILSKLPQLPKEVVYRIIGRDLILLDHVANIVVDYVPEALPPI